VSDIAIIGMSCLFPGAPDLATYWANIVSKVDAIGDPPPEWEAERYFDPAAEENDRIYCRRGGFLRDLARFNPSQYGVMPNSVDGSEPDHFLSLRVAHEALADAGYSAGRVNRTQIEVILGRGTYINRGYTNLIQHGLMVDQTIRILKQLHPDYTDDALAEIKRDLKRSLPPFNAEVVPGLVPNIVTGRITNRLDFMGQNYTVDAACASSLIAIDHGLRDLASGRCDVAIVGGVHASTPAPILMIFSQLGALSRRPHLRPFDQGADGTILGEGLGIVVLKRRADAERDGDKIYALIKGVGIASDGRALGLLTPRVEGEELALRRAYESSGISPQTVGLIEAHGTGTPVGDVTEIQALTRVFGPRNGPPRCAVGSVKSMIGHTMPASGAAGVIKAALALHHKILPPTLHCDTPNPKLELERTPFYINTETRPWIHGAADAPRRAGVNAFGFGGINAHLILEEYTGTDESTAPSLLQSWDSELVLLQGESLQELRQTVHSLEHYLKTAADIAIRDVAYTFNTQQPPRTYRLAMVAASIEELLKKLDYAATRLADPACRQIKERTGVYYFCTPLAPHGKVVFLFPGEGSQYLNMLSDLCCHFPDVRQQFDLMDRAFTQQGRSYLPSDVIFPPPTALEGTARSADEQLWQMDVGAEAVFAASQGMLSLLNRLKVRADCVVGHSTGEYSALLASGALRVNNEAQLIGHILVLNRIYQDMDARKEIPEGFLLAVGGVDRQTVEAVIAGGSEPICVAMDNCPHQLVLCGSRSAIAWASSQLASKGAICSPLPFERPYHTALFEPVCAALKEFFDALPLTAPDIPIYSCATTGPMPDDGEKIRGIALSQWSQPVRFRETIERLYADGVRIFIEVGPKGNLTGFVDDILTTRPHLAVASDSHRRSGTTQLNHTLGLLAAHHLPIDLEPLYQRRHPRRLMLDVNQDRASRREPGVSMPIAMGLQPLRLDKRTGTDAQPRSTPAPSLAPASTARSGAPLTPPQAVPRSPVLTGTPEFVGSTPQSTNGSTRDKTLQAYFKTMDEFLTIQQTVLDQYLSKSASKPVSKTVHVQPPVLVTAAPGPAPVLSAAPVTGVPAPSDPFVATPDQPRVDHAGRVERLILELVAEKTGYPIELLGLDLDLEADLGIDSIKRVEILGAAKRAFTLSLPDRVPDQIMERLTGKKTLRDIIRCFADGSSVSSTAALPETTLERDNGQNPLPAYPFIGTITIFEPGRRLEATRRIDPTEDIFLLHHTLGSSVSSTDRTLTALPVMPLTMTMEIMAQAAAMLAPGLRLVRMREIRAYRWIAFDRPPVTLAMTAARTSDQKGTTIEVKIRECSEFPGTPEPVLAECVADFADHHPPAPIAEPLPLKSERPSKWQPDNLYTEGMFHGPTFQGVASVDRWGEDGAEATLTVLPLDRLFRSVQNPTWITDPIVLDAAGQLIGYWTAEHLSTGFNIFPYRLRELQLFGPLLPAGTHLACRARIRLEGDQLMSSNIDVIGPDGRLHMRLLGWEDRRFELPDSFFRLRIAPASTFISRMVDGVTNRLPAGRYACAFFEGYEGDLLEAHAQIWRRVLAHLVLSRSERDAWHSLQGPDKRRLEWLLGRVAAKDAVRLHLQQRHGLSSYPADIAIGADPHGRPTVSSPVSALGVAEPILTLAHSHGAAIAVAGDHSAGNIGVDLEPADRHPMGFDELAPAFSPDERRRFEHWRLDPHSNWPTRLWCAKEAMAKALGWGLMGRPQDFVVVDLNTDTNVVRLTVRGASALKIPESAGRVFDVHTLHEGRWIIALSHIEKENA
jgi:acyl transferase domain-containing protein/phosphopantetheinyl transferase/acyl carrier protein/predicted hotdog family 3-hydroxylacyl-ACP dehydratase